MTRKDYKEIAAILAKHQDFSNVDELAKDLAEYMVKQNPKFDIIRFMKAARNGQRHE